MIEIDTIYNMDCLKGLKRLDDCTMAQAAGAGTWNITKEIIKSNDYEDDLHQRSDYGLDDGPAA